MSWLPKFGGTGVPTAPSQDGSAGSPSGDDKNKEKAKEITGQWSAFDPTGLERAAKAVRELDSSPHAKEALQLAKMQETTEHLKQQENIKVSVCYRHLCMVDHHSAVNFAHSDQYMCPSGVWGFLMGSTTGIMRTVGPLK
jgi:hypothetical protein